MINIPTKILVIYLFSLNSLFFILFGTTDSQSSLSGGNTAWQSEFPTNGAVPYMIATDQSVDWSPELTHIDPSWLGGDMSTDNGSYTVTVEPITTTTP